MRKPSSLRFLLITGIPGTGKSAVGEYLREQYGFRHLDFEKGSTRLSYLGRPAEVKRRIEALKTKGRDVVITWGFVPDSQLDFVLALRDLGFKWVWFDGNREAALREYRRAGRPKTAWDVQLAKIETHIDPKLGRLAPIIVNSFDAAGHFRPLEDVSREALDIRAASA